MHKTRAALVVLLAVGVIASTLGAFPLMNVVAYDNQGGWFTMQNVDDYGQDLDRRTPPGEQLVVFTGHPGYVIGADRARLLFDMPRIHYLASTFNGTAYGNRFFARLIRALRSGRADIAIGNSMTQAILRLNETAADAFRAQYCLADDAATRQLYARTGGRLYRYHPDCPADRVPDPRNMTATP